MRNNGCEDENTIRSPKDRIKFDCKFTPEIRELFRRHRQELGLSYYQLSLMFGVNWSTIRKWEKGPTDNCALAFRPLVESFINGEFDDQLRLQLQERIQTNYDARIHAMSISFSKGSLEEFNECIGILSQTVQFLKNKPFLLDRLLNDVDFLLKDFLNSQKPRRMHVAEDSMPYDENHHSPTQPDADS